MADVIDIAGIPVTLRRSARARRMTLRIARIGGEVTLTLPGRIARREAEAFARGHADWIARQVAAVPAPRGVAVGGTIPLGGRDVPVIAGTGRAARWTGAAIAVPDDRHAARRVRLLVRELARSHLVAAVSEHAGALGKVPGRITLRDTRSRWGSCSGRGDLMFSWRLAMAPPAILDYVAAHEVAHLVHMDHSPRFWACVAGLMHDYAPRRAWLRREGAALHAVRFDRT